MYGSWNARRMWIQGRWTRKKADGDTKTDGSGDSKGYHFEVVVKSFQSSYWQAAVQGINQACDELGVTANTTRTERRVRYR